VTLDDACRGDEQVEPVEAGERDARGVGGSDVDVLAVDAAYLPAVGLQPGDDGGADAGGGAGDDRRLQTLAAAAAITRSTSSSVCAVQSTECSAGDGDV
jgi:hypothetical protein